MRPVPPQSFTNALQLTCLAVTAIVVTQGSASAEGNVPLDRRGDAAESSPNGFDDPELRRFNRQAVAEVEAGRRTTASAAWWGFDPQDGTKALQDAINSGAQRLLVPKMDGEWIVQPIFLASDQEIIFEEGVVVAAKPGAFKGVMDNLFSARGKTNINLRGSGAIFRMRKQDYTSEAYPKAEWRHALGLYGCSNVRIEGLTFRDSGGDGIYIGAGGEGANHPGYGPFDPNLPLFCSRVHIKDVVCDNNHRQGVSVTGADELLIENTRLANTGGTLPQSGIDFEPNSPGCRMSSIALRNCIIEDNAGSGIVFHFKQLDRQKSHPVSITIGGTRVQNNRLAVYFSSDLSSATAPRGRIIFYADNQMDMSKVQMGIPPGGDKTIALDSEENIRRVQEMTPSIDVQVNVPVGNQPDG